MMGGSPESTELERKDRLEKLLKDIPMRAFLMELFFAGYLLGKQVTEVEKLDSIAL